MEAEIEYEERIVLEAYHGTSADNEEEIKEEGFRLSKGRNQFLGDGAYFFLHSSWHAEDWASKQRGYDTIAIFQAMVDLGRCLDLYVPEHRQILRKVHSELEERGVDPLTDAVVINFFATQICTMDTVKAPYVQPKYGKIFPGSRFDDYVQNLLCVRNRGNILEFEVVYSDS
jgi:hypothetical protein